MKYLDEVMVTVNKQKYIKHGIVKGAIGTIILSEIRSNTFYVVFSRSDGSDYAEMGINVEDLILVKSSRITDADILEDLPKNDPHWWCKVENGYILNLLNERKNKIAYDYNS